MAVYLDQAINVNITRGDFGYDVIQWMPWTSTKVYCAQFVQGGKKYFGASRVPYQDWSERNTHDRDGGRNVKVIGCLEGVRSRGKGPVMVTMETNDRFIVELGASVVEAVRSTIPRRRVQDRDPSSNAMR